MRSANVRYSLASLRAVAPSSLTSERTVASLSLVFRGESKPPPEPPLATQSAT